MKERGRCANVLSPWHSYGMVPIGWLKPVPAPSFMPIPKFILVALFGLVILPNLLGAIVYSILDSVDDEQY